MTDQLPHFRHISGHVLSHLLPVYEVIIASSPDGNQQIMLEEKAFPFNKSRIALFARGFIREKTKPEPNEVGLVLKGGATWQLSREGIERESIPFQQFEQSGLFACGRAAGPPKKKHLLSADASFLEAPPGFEPGQSRICSPLPYHLAMAPDIGKEGFLTKPSFLFCGAAYEARTRYLHLGKVALYQMS